VTTHLQSINIIIIIIIIIIIKSTRDLYRGISDGKEGYQPRSDIVKDKKGNLVTDCHSILAGWRNHFSQLFNVHGVSDVRQTETHTAEPLVPEPSALEVELANEKIKGHKSLVLIKYQEN